MASERWGLFGLLPAYDSLDELMTDWSRNTWTATVTVTRWERPAIPSDYVEGYTDQLLEELYDDLDHQFSDGTHRSHPDQEVILVTRAAIRLAITKYQPDWKAVETREINLEEWRAKGAAE